MDYLQHGMQINAIVSIDFTGSNGIPTHPQSLHYLQPQFFNQYENAIQSVGTIIQVENVFFSYFLSIVLGLRFGQAIPCLWVRC